MEGTFAIIGVFGMIPLIVFLGLHFRNKARAKNVELVQAMLDKDKEITPEIIRAVGFTGKRSHSDLRIGMILAAVGAAAESPTGMKMDIEQAMNRLSPEQRAAVMLCLSYGFSHSEAGKALGQPLGTVKSHVARGKDKLRAFLSVYEKA